MHSFENKVALVTGGTSGIGRVTAEKLASLGASVVVAGRSSEKGALTVNSIEAAGGKALFVKTDVSNEEQVKNLVEKTLEAFGRLDFAFNNAGVEQTPMPLGETTEELYHSVMDANVKGVWLCLKHEIPAMLKSGGGAIVNTSSYSGVISFATIPLYSASKHAVVGLTKSVALEFAKQNIRVNAILPGAVEDTGTFERSFGGNNDAIEWAKSIHPMGRLAKPGEIADSVIYMLSDAAGFMTGHSLIVDGGYTAG
ncbi:MAG: SDR family oxidoreductase [Firmicutes bacterium]|nr:SDR family oxidoreductase [Bacillota bacterium]